MIRRPAALVLATLLTSACGDSRLPARSDAPPPAPPGVPDGSCGDYSATRNAYFGDLHVHSSYSFDSYLFGNHVNDPEVAYDFAQGARIRLNDSARGERHVQLRQPLDFAAVTDHSEYLGEVALCTDPTANPLAYNDPLCVQFRNSDPNSELGFLIWGFRLTEPVFGRHHFCAYGDCKGRAASVWEQNARITDAANQPCRFTSFNAYEYSPSSAGARLHRNIVFRGSKIPELPVSYFEAPNAVELFQQLDAACKPEDGCEFLSIPHNANLSHGRLLWADPERFGDPDYVAGLRRISELNPVMELMQIKGASECKLGLGGTTDEECQFEQLREKPLCCDPAQGITEYCVAKNQSPSFYLSPNCHEVCPGDAPKAIQYTPDNSTGCLASHDFLRGALQKGMRARETLGFNPFQFGLIASTDNHNSASGDVDEGGPEGAPLGWEGAHGGQDDDPGERLGVLTNIGRITNPGGLAGIWAEHNTRDALFAALKRKEVFATSGTRMQLRFFGGNYPAGLCQQGGEALQQQGYRDGVAMGGELRGERLGGPPRFLIQSFADSHPLQRTEVVKLWVDAQGRSREKIHQIASYSGLAEVGEDCAVRFSDPPETRLSACHEWTDPEFDATRPASYYVRSFEDASCRWTGHLCAALKKEGTVDCAAEPEHACCPGHLDSVRQAIQERVWSSPIWYQPAAAP